MTFQPPMNPPPPGSGPLPGGDTWRLAWLGALGAFGVGGLTSLLSYLGFLIDVGADALSEPSVLAYLAGNALVLVGGVLAVVAAMSRQPAPAVAAGVAAIAGAAVIAVASLVQLIAGPGPGSFALSSISGVVHSVAVAAVGLAALLGAGAGRRPA